MLEVISLLGGKHHRPTGESGFVCLICGSVTSKPHPTFTCSSCGVTLCEHLTSEHLQSCPQGVLQRQVKTSQGQVGEELHPKAQRNNSPLGGGGGRQPFENGGEEEMSDDGDGGDDDGGGDIPQAGPSGLRPHDNNRDRDGNSSEGEDVIDIPHLINRVGALGDLFTRMEYSIPPAFATDPVGLLSNFR
nr:uncharacterized protein LOC123753367 [Procambarus clarkii]